jgi:hypothetical protein
MIQNPKQTINLGVVKIAVKPCTIELIVKIRGWSGLTILQIRITGREDLRSFKNLVNPTYR